MPFVTWIGDSGQSYDFELYPMHTIFRPIPACYIFVKQVDTQSWGAIYIGETENIRQRFDWHEKMPCITRHGATHVCIYTQGMEGRLRRYTLEGDLLRRISPPCNG